MLFFYPSKNHNFLNKLRFRPESVARRVMVNPHYLVDLDVPDVDAWIDSGAFQERDMRARLTPVKPLIDNFN